MASIKLDITVTDKERAGVDRFFKQFVDKTSFMTVEDYLAVQTYNAVVVSIAETGLGDQGQELGDKYRAASIQVQDQIRALLEIPTDPDIAAPMGFMGKIANFFTGGSNNA